jgi:integrase
MPRLVSATPKYRHHRASGQAVVTITGKDHYLGPWKSKASQVEYDRLVGEWMAAGRPALPSASPAVVTVAEVVAAFWRFAQKHYMKNGRATGTADNYKPALSLLKTRYGRTPAIEFGPLALKSLRQLMIDQGQARRYVNENVHRIRKVFRWAASEQLIPSSVPESLWTVEGLHKGLSEARETAPIVIVEETVIEATLPHLSATVADMVRLQRLTGARPGEICAMRPADIDRTGEVWRYTPAEHKTEHHGKRRVIAIGPRAQAVLLPYLLRDAEAYCFCPAVSERQRRREQHERRVTPLSCGNKPDSNRRRKRERAPGHRYTNDSYRRAVARACEIAFNMPANLRRIGAGDEQSQLREAANDWRTKHVWHPNQLRHSAATDIRAKFGIEAVQHVLGHARLDMAEVYAEKNFALAASVARAVG